MDITMEEELIAQRDAAIAVSRELRKKMDEQIELIERRALNAERLRVEAENRLRLLEKERKWEAATHERDLQFAIFCGILGALCGWGLGVIVAILLEKPLLGFMLVLPAMGIGMTFAVALSRTQARIERRQRIVKQKSFNANPLDELLGPQRTDGQATDNQPSSSDGEEKLSLSRIALQGASRSFYFSKKLVVDYWTARGKGSSSPSGSPNNRSQDGKKSQ